MATDAERRAAAKAAFDKRQARIRKDKGVTVAQRNTQKEDTIERARIVANLGLAVGSALPLGAVIRNGILIYRGLKGAKALAALRKVEQAKKIAKGPRVTKVKSPNEVAVSKLSPNKRPSAAQQAATKPKPKPENKVKTNKELLEALKKKSASRTSKSNKLTPKGKKLVGAAAAVTAAGTTALGTTATQLSATQSKDTKATKRKATGMADRKTSKSKTAKRKPTGMGDRKTSKPTVEASKRKATGMGDRKARKPVEKKRTTRTDKEIAAKMLTRKETEERPSPRSFSPDKAKEGAATKRTNISASKNTGFGPKGNIFPSNAAARKRLMAKYGGTGSAAAKAAARGTQGNLKKGKK